MIYITVPKNFEGTISIAVQIDKYYPAETENAGNVKITAGDKTAVYSLTAKKITGSKTF